MKHIRQINSVDTNTYTIVKTDDWDNPLEEHPCIINQPDVYEIADCEIPQHIQYVDFNL